MGYSYKFYSIPKKVVEEIKNCKTNDEYIQLCENHQFSVDDDDEEKRCAPYKIGKEIHNFGKEIYFYDEIEKCQLLFSSDELNKEYSDYNVRICNKATFEAVIQIHADKIKSLYENLLKEKSPFPWDTRTQLERLLSNAQDYYVRWKNPWNRPPYNLDMETEQITSSSLYEHVIFELVRLYKTFDWEHDDLIFMGW